jgi:predicted nucleic acid-binding protein
MLNNTKSFNEDIQNRAKQLENEGIKPMDALHIACAELMSCDYFLTSDDRLLKRYKGHLLQIKNPVEFILLLTEKNYESKNVK